MFMMSAVNPAAKDPGLYERIGAAAFCIAFVHLLNQQSRQAQFSWHREIIGVARGMRTLSYPLCSASLHVELACRLQGGGTSGMGGLAQGLCLGLAFGIGLGWQREMC